MMRGGIGADCLGDGAQLVFEVAEVRAGLEVVAPTVRDDAAIKDVDFADAPAIETRFLKEMLEDAICTDLHVADARASAASARASVSSYRRRQSGGAGSEPAGEGAGPGRLLCRDTPWRPP